MAKASVDTVTKTVTEEVDEEVIQLTLTKTEARALYALSLFVSGDQATTYHREITSIRNAVGLTGKLGYVQYYNMFQADDGGVLKARPHLTGDK